MKAGRELDIYIAEYVMGLKKACEGFEQSNFEPLFIYEDGIAYRAKDYSSDITDAWEVVEKIRSNSPYSGFHLHTPGGYDRHHHFGASFEKEWADKPEENRSTNTIYVSGETAPHAICLAAREAQLNNIAFFNKCVYNNK